MKWNDRLVKQVGDLILLGRTTTEIAKELGISERAVSHRRLRPPLRGMRPLGSARKVSEGKPLVQVSADEDATKNKAQIVLAALEHGPKTHASLMEAAGVGMPELGRIIADLQRKHEITQEGHFVQFGTPKFGRLPLELLATGDWFRFGGVADTHLACQEERLDALHATYQLFQREGIEKVFHAGNMVDGYVQRINGASAIVTTIDDQLLYVVDNYPRIPGITTYFITGDDHEGWWIKEGVNVGRYLEMLARENGRDDLVYLGHVEADVEFKTGNPKPVIMKVQHPGGGSCYARSYAGQKQVESFQGGEKPDILLQGHYHVNSYMLERNVHVVGLPGFQDQTVFARKKRLRMDVGGGIIEFQVNQISGGISRFRYELIPFFDRGYYKAFLRSDARLIKGHLTIDKP